MLQHVSCNVRIKSPARDTSCRNWNQRKFCVNEEETISKQIVRQIVKHDCFQSTSPRLQTKSLNWFTKLSASITFSKLILVLCLSISYSIWKQLCKWMNVFNISRTYWISWNLPLVQVGFSGLHFPRTHFAVLLPTKFETYPFLQISLMTVPLLEDKLCSLPCLTISTS